MSSDVDALADVIASALAADHIQSFSTIAVEAKGMHKQRIRAACDHAVHWGGPASCLAAAGTIVHGPRATRSAGGKFDDEEQQRHDDSHYHYAGQFHASAFD